MVKRQQRPGHRVQVAAQAGQLGVARRVGVDRVGHQEVDRPPRHVGLDAEERVQQELEHLPHQIARPREIRGQVGQIDLRGRRRGQHQRQREQHR